MFREKLFTSRFHDHTADAAYQFGGYWEIGSRIGIRDWEFGLREWNWGFEFDNWNLGLESRIEVC